MSKTIFHIDLDAFFPSCEEAINPAYRGKPVIVGGRTKRSVVSSANYEARKYGVHAAMPVWQAQKLCPQAILLNGNYELYDKMSRQFFDFIKKHYVNVCEEMSIDECFLDVSSVIKHYNNDPIALAKKIQQDVKKQLHLSVSIGIAPNKFLAKMATDLNKPFGITTILTQKEIEEKLWPLPIKDMFFVGPSTAKKLNQIGINTIRDLALYEDTRTLQILLGKNWASIQDNALGYGDDFVDVSKNDPKSLSISHTLLDPTIDIVEIETTYKYLSQQLAEKVESYNMTGRVITINWKIDGKVYTRNLTLNKYINSWEDICMYACQLFGQNWNGIDYVQLIGVGLTKLVKLDNIEFLNMNIAPKKKSSYQKIADEVNKKLGKDLVFVAKDKLFN